MEFNSDISNNLTVEDDNPNNLLINNNPNNLTTNHITQNSSASKLITAITDFIPAFFSPGGILVKENEGKSKPTVLETIIQSEDFFKEHPESFRSDESKNSFVINKLAGTARRWGLSLLGDGTLKSLRFDEFKALLLENFDSGSEKKQKYVIMDKLWRLKQLRLGEAAEYTIEFRRLAGRLGWPDEVLIDIIGKGLVDRVREEFDKLNKPDTLFEATNTIIGIDKKCYLESCIRHKSDNKSKASKSFHRKRKELTKTENRFKKSKFRKNKPNKEILSANYTPSGKLTVTTTFFISCNNKNLRANILIDSGSGRSFLCKNFVNANKIPTSGLSSPIKIQLPNDKCMTIKQTTKPLKLKTLDHSENFEFCIGNISLEGVNGILGRDWLRKHNPFIDYERNKIYFLGKHCKSHCPSSRKNKFIIQNSNITAPMLDEDSYTAKETLDSIIPTTISEDELYEDVCAAMDTSTEGNKEKSRNESIIKKFYSDLKIVFEKKEAEKLPPHRKYDISIDLIVGGQLYYGPIYSLTVKELKALRKYIKENLKKKFIRKSKSPAGAPILFVMKHDGTLRLVVDYRRLNAITIRNSYPIPRISDLIESFKGASIFTRLDLRSAYNLVRVKEGNEYLTAFRTPLGHYEYLVMPFGLRNAPSVFQRFIQDVLDEVIGTCAQVYLDDIIIYSKNLEDHVKHVRLVLSLLIKNGLYAKLEKCEFHVKETTFLGFVVSINGLRMDRNKVRSVLEWPIPKNLKELQSFLGLCNFYRKFIKNFAKNMEPLRKLLKKENQFIWNDEADSAFNKLKSAFETDEVLIFPDHDKEFIVETDASDFAVGCVLSQVCDKDNLLHPVAFHSRSLNKAELNYTIYDKELLAIITAFDTWRHHLEGAKFPVQVLTDHKNLLYLKKPQHLNQRQIRWSLFLSKFDFRVAYRPGAKGGKPDALSRRPDYKKDIPVVSQSVISEKAFCYTISDNISGLIEAQKADKYCNEILKKIKQHDKKLKSSLFSYIEGVLHFQKRIIVPSALKARLLKSFHDAPTSGHQGVDRTFEKLQRYYWWPNMKKDVQNYVASCDVCCRSKIRRHKPYGKLQPLPIPSKPWEVIGVDFIVYLPTSQNCTCIMVVSDHLTKMVHLMPCADVPSADLTAKLLLFNVFKYHGFPKTIVSDHGSQFSSEFWTSLCSAVRAKPRLATAHHQQSNGQVERANAVIEQYLRCYCSSAQSEWCFYLPLCEFAYNNSMNKSIGHSPFFANYGFHPNAVIDSPPILLKDNASVLTRDWAAHFDALRQHLSKAKEDFKKYGDTRKSTGPNFQVNDLVYLKRHYFTNEPAKKLSSQYLGPFKIIEKRERMNYRLELPENLRLHPVFHISQLEPYVKRNKELEEPSL